MWSPKICYISIQKYETQTQNVYKNKKICITAVNRLPFIPIFLSHRSIKSPKLVQLIEVLPSLTCVANTHQHHLGLASLVSTLYPPPSTSTSDDYPKNMPVTPGPQEDPIPSCVHY